MRGRPAIPRAGSVVEAGRESAREGAVEPPPAVLVGHDLVLDRDRLLLLGRRVLVELGEGRPVDDGRAVVIVIVVFVVGHGFAAALVSTLCVLVYIPYSWELVREFEMELIAVLSQSRSKIMKKCFKLLSENINLIYSIPYNFTKGSSLTDYL